MILETSALAWLTGLATGAGLIMAIGAQNAFVLTQGIKQQYHWPIAGLCSAFDAILITAGVAGVGALIHSSQSWLLVARWGGALFLLVYGAMALRSAFNTQGMEVRKDKVGSLKVALLTTVSVTLLNPHAYLDTLVLIGSIGGQYQGNDKWFFSAGAVSFSFIWFFGLSYGARWLAPLFANPLSWRILDGIVCLIMWSIALSLVI